MLKALWRCLDVADLRLTGSASVSDGRIYGDVMLVCCICVCTGWFFVVYVKYGYVYV